MSIAHVGLVKEILKKFFCRHKNKTKVPVAELTLGDFNNMHIGIRPYYCNDCKSRVDGLFGEDKNG